MPRQKVFLFIFSSFLVGIIFTALFFVVLKSDDPSVSLALSKRDGSTAATSTLPTAEEKEPEPPLMVYRNRKYGFEFFYPQGLVFVEDAIKEDKTDIVMVGWPGSDGKPANLLSTIYTMPKKSVEEFIRIEKRNIEQCKEHSFFGNCLHSSQHSLWIGRDARRTKYAGVDAVESHYGGEGSEDGYVALPTKGLIIYFPYLYQGEEREIKPFAFIDQNKDFEEKITGFTFTCPAFYTCAPRDSHASGAEYHLDGPEWSFGLSFQEIPTSTFATSFAQVQKQYVIDFDNYQANLKAWEKCRAIGWPDSCNGQFGYGERPVPPGTITKTTFANYQAIDDNFLDGEQRSISIPEKGWKITFYASYNKQITDDVIKLFFGKAHFNP